jgi:hypothetical protein
VPPADLRQARRYASAHDWGVRTEASIVKHAIPKYNARGPNFDHTTYKATVTIEMLTAAT